MWNLENLKCGTFMSVWNFGQPRAGKTPSCSSCWGTSQRNKPPKITACLLPLFSVQVIREAQEKPGQPRTESVMIGCPPCRTASLPQRREDMLAASSLISFLGEASKIGCLFGRPFLLRTHENRRTFAFNRLSYLSEP